MTLAQRSLEVYKSKLAEEERSSKVQVTPGSLQMKARLRQLDADKAEAKKNIKSNYWLNGQPRPGRYTFTSISATCRKKKASLVSGSINAFRSKMAGGPGSGVKENNTIPIVELPMSKLISIGKRKEFMDKHKPKKECTICLSKIKFVSQKKMIPEKVLKFCNTTEIKDLPIDVVEDSNKDFHVMDGHHRFLAKLHQGSDGIKAKVYDGKPLEEKEKKASIAPSFKRPAIVSSQGIKKNLNMRRNDRGNITSATTPEIKPLYDNRKLLKDYFWANPYLG